MAIALDASNETNSGGAGTTQSATITIASNSNRALFVIIHYSRNGGTSITSVKIGSTSFALAVSSQHGAGGDLQNCDIYYLINPPTGSQQVDVVFNNSLQADIGLVSLYNVDQTTVIGAVNDSSSTNSISVTPTNVGAWLLMGAQAGNSALTSASDTELYSVLGTEGGGHYIAAQYKSNPTIGSSNTLSWSGGGGNGATAIVEILLATVPQQKDFTTDILVQQKNNLKTFTADLLVTKHKKFTVDTILVRVKRFTTDIIITKLEERKTFTTDLLSVAKKTKLLLVDLLAALEGTKAYTIDTIVAKYDNLKTFTVDLLVKNTPGFTTFSVDLKAAIKQITENFQVDLLSTLRYRKTFSVDLIVAVPSPGDNTSILFTRQAIQDILYVDQ